MSHVPTFFFNGVISSHDNGKPHFTLFSNETMKTTILSERPRVGLGSYIVDSLYFVSFLT